jgi:cytochrome c biogenesis protein ResB
MLTVSLCCSLLIVPSVYSSVYFVLCLVYPMLTVSWQHRIHKTQDTINTRVNRRENQEWTTQTHSQHRIHKTQDKIKYPMLSVSLCCLFLIVPFVYSSVYFVLCLVYPMLSVSLCYYNQEWTTQRHWQHRIHKIQDKINTRVNRRDNQEWTTQRNWQHRIHKIQDKINTSLFCPVSCVSDVVSVSVLFILDCPFCLL